MRKIELTIYRRLPVDKETHNILREQKKIQKKSMMRILKDDVKEKYT